MKKEKSTTSSADQTKAPKTKSTSGGGKDKNGGGLPASALKSPSEGGAGKDGRSGGRGA